MNIRVTIGVLVLLMFLTGPQLANSSLNSAQKATVTIGLQISSSRVIPIGSGFVIEGRYSSVPYIATCAHVLAVPKHLIEKFKENFEKFGGKNYSPFYVKFIDNKRWFPTYAASAYVDTDRDLALLNFNWGFISKADMVKVIPYANKKPDLGSTVYAIGTPESDMKREGTITAGIISLTTSDYGTGAFQMDAAISRGNSGGPVLNDKGELVGVAFAGLAREINTTKGEVKHLWSYNFAVYASHVKNLVAKSPNNSVTIPILSGNLSAAGNTGLGNILLYLASEVWLMSEEVKDLALSNYELAESKGSPLATIMKGALIGSSSTLVLQQATKMTKSQQLKKFIRTAVKIIF